MKQATCSACPLWRKQSAEAGWCRLNRCNAGGWVTACVDMRAHLEAHARLRLLAGQFQSIGEALAGDARNAINADNHANAQQWNP